MDGLVELMFIGIFILASIFDAVARTRRKKQRMEEMEAEESAEDDGSREWDAGDASREWDAGTQEPEPWQRTDSEPAATTRHTPDRADAPDRRTADDMVPDDLWAILTGQERPTRRTEGPSRGEGAGGTEEPWALEAPGGRARSDRELEPPEAPGIPMPVPSDRYRGGGGSQPSGSPVGATIGETEIGSSDLPEIREVRPAAVDAGSLARRPVGELDDSIAALRGPSRRGASPYTAKLRRGGREGLREAVVLSEVLGDPVAIRRRGGRWDGEPR